MAAVDLTTIANVKSWLGAGGNAMGTTEDTLLTRLITAASIQILNYVNRPFLLSQSVTEIFDGKGGVTYVPINYPITGVTSLVVDGVTVPASPDGIASGWWLYQDQITVIGSNFGLVAGSDWGQYRFNRGRGNCKLVYTAGYGAGSNDMLAIEQACIDLVAFKYRSRKWIGLRAENLGPSGGTTYDKRGIPDDVAAALQNYIRMTPN